MLELYRDVVGSRVLHVVVTERTDGDQRPDRDTAAGATGRAIRQRELTGSDWSMVAEEHGVGVVDLDVPAPSPQVLAAGDVLVTQRPDVHLAIWAGDCAPLVLCGASGTLIAVHAGWRGLAAGIVNTAIARFDERDDTVARAVLGPCIHVECYEFGAEDLLAVAAGVGVPAGEITGSTSDGLTRLDVPAAVAAALRRHRIDLDVVGPCTSCDERWFSHRARAEEERHALVAWTTSVGSSMGTSTS